MTGAAHDLDVAADGASAQLHDVDRRHRCLLGDGIVLEVELRPKRTAHGRTVDPQPQPRRHPRARHPETDCTFACSPPRSDAISWSPETVATEMSPCASPTSTSPETTLTEKAPGPVDLDVAGRGLDEPARLPRATCRRSHCSS